MTPPAVELSFDDGPDPVWTPAVLGALRRLGARATFFVLAPRAVAHPEVMRRHRRRRATRSGSTAWDHVRHGDAPAPTLERDTDARWRPLASLGVAPRRWRTPWGELAPWTAEVVARAGSRSPAGPPTPTTGAGDHAEPCWPPWSPRSARAGWC